MKVGFKNLTTDGETEMWINQMLLLKSHRDLLNKNSSFLGQKVGSPSFSGLVVLKTKTENLFNKSLCDFRSNI